MNNIGSIIDIHYAFSEDIASITDPDDDGFVEITMESGESFQEIAFTPESASFNESEEKVEAGSYFNQNLTFRIPKVGSTNYSFLASMQNKDFILLITDGNGNTIVMGTVAQPARMNYRVLRPGSPSGYNGYELTFQAKCMDPAPFHDGVSPLPVS